MVLLLPVSMENTQDLVCCHSCMNHLILPVVLSPSSWPVLPQIMTFTASPHPFPISLLPPHLQILVMALSLQDEDSVLQLLHSSLEQVVLLHHGTEAMLQLPLPVCQHFDLQGKERPCQTSQEPERRDATFQKEK